MFAPVGQRYKTEYYYPEFGLFGWEKEFELVMGPRPESAGEESKVVEEQGIRPNYAIPIYPGITEGYGEDIVEEHFQNFQAEILLQVCDAWALTRIPDLAAQNRIRWIVQPAVDFLKPLPQHDFVDKLKPALKVVPWTRSAYDELKDAGLENLWDPIPLGVNCTGRDAIWVPRNRADFPGAMADMGFGYDTFNISIVNANQYLRKGWEQTFRGIKIFREEHPDIQVRLYLHTFLNNADGWDMPKLLANTGLSDITRMANQYTYITGQFNEFQLMLVHALADVVVSAGLEGFGYATVQAGAVGTPTIGLNAGATPELLEKAVLVPPYFDYLTPNMLHKTDTHPRHIAKALEAVAMETPRSEYQGNIQFVRENFAWSVVCEKWRKLFAEVERDLDHRCIKSRKYPPSPSEKLLQMATKRIEIA